MCIKSPIFWNDLSPLICVGHPILRRQAVVGLPDFGSPELAWRVEDAALHRSGMAIDGSPHRYLCVRCWKPRFSWRCGAVITKMAVSDFRGRKSAGWPQSPDEHQKTFFWRRGSCAQLGVLRGQAVAWPENRVVPSRFRLAGHSVEAHAKPRATFGISRSPCGTLAIGASPL